MWERHTHRGRERERERVRAHLCMRVKWASAPEREWLLYMYTPTRTHTHTCTHTRTHAETHTHTHTHIYINTKTLLYLLIMTEGNSLRDDTILSFLEQTPLTKLSHNSTGNFWPISYKITYKIFLFIKFMLNWVNMLRQRLTMFHAPFTKLFFVMWKLRQRTQFTLPPVWQKDKQYEQKPWKFSVCIEQVSNSWSHIPHPLHLHVLICSLNTKAARHMRVVLILDLLISVINTRFINRILIFCPQLRIWQPAYDLFKCVPWLIHCNMLQHTVTHCNILQHTRDSFVRVTCAARGKQCAVTCLMLKSQVWDTVMTQWVCDDEMTRWVRGE